MVIGVLALQGDFEAHRTILEACGVQVQAVRDAAALDECEALVIPGGESTVMSRLCDRYGLWQPLRRRVESGMGVLGTCAGLILLAKNMSGASRNFPQQTLGTLDVDVARNAYGSQVDSFEADVTVPLLGDSPVRAVFIRAPQITRCGAEVEVLAEHEETPVVVRQGPVMATAFHPEIAGDTRLHQLWLDGIMSESTHPEEHEASL
ncbi:MAG: pyridoxal 5'-phosphate synthase glutaminase subunit PdxT [Armatimonadota bacterium]|nr:pyridoxal 5'-phosphate synthase glutaminase subunit PdxT [Armatimonadota bacterium]